MRFSLLTGFAASIAVMGVIGMFVGVLSGQEHVAGTGAFVWMGGGIFYVYGIGRDERDIRKD